MNKILTKEVKIALVAIAGVVILFFGMNFLKGLTIFSTDLPYQMTFNNVDGLANSSPIYADGYRVGTVTGITYDYEKSGNIIVDVDIDRDLRIPLGSTAEISSDFMGNTQVNLLLANNPRQRINPGEVIPGNVDAGALGELKELIPTIQKIVPKLDSIMGSLNTLLADPALANTLHNAEAITANIKTSTVELNTLMTGLNGQVPGMLQKADRVMTTAGNVMANAEKVTGNLAAVDVAATMAKVDATLNNVQQFTDALNSREGTVGLMLHDPSLYNNLNATMRNADSLVIDLKSHPKRYVHFSVFGGKDK